MNANFLWRTDSRWIVFSCSLNVCHTAECCMFRLGNSCTLNDCFVFACPCSRFRCEPGLRYTLLIYSNILCIRHVFNLFGKNRYTLLIKWLLTNRMTNNTPNNKFLFRSCISGDTVFSNLYFICPIYLYLLISAFPVLTLVIGLQYSKIN